MNQERQLDVPAHPPSSPPVFINPLRVLILSHHPALTACQSAQHSYYTWVRYQRHQAQSRRDTSQSGWSCMIANDCVSPSFANFRLLSLQSPASCTKPECRPQRPRLRRVDVRRVVVVMKQPPALTTHPSILGFCQRQFFPRSSRLKEKRRDGDDSLLDAR